VDAGLLSREFAHNTQPALPFFHSITEGDPVTNKEIATLTLLVFGLALWAINWWKSRKSSENHPVASEPLGADDPAPPGTIGFNQAILEACGDKVPDSFKLKQLLDPSMTRHVAAIRARQYIENPAAAALANAGAKPA
jgi:hypothetical protein